MESTELVAPTVDLEAEYRAFLEDFQSTDEELVPFVLEFDHSDFHAMVARLEGYARGDGLQAGFVEHSTFWLVTGSESRVVGVANIRHRLTDKLRAMGGHIGFRVCPSERGKGYATEMLRLALQRAKDLGIDRALVTCDQGNEASALVIQKNGGALEAEGVVDGVAVQRYWIDIS